MNQIQNKSAYIPLPSAFQLIDIPIQYMHGTVESAHPQGGNPRIVPFFAAYFGGGFVVYCIAVCATPVTIVADMVAGVAECAFCTLKGYSSAEIASLAKKKFLVSPLHQLIFLATATVIPILLTPLLTLRMRLSVVPTNGEFINSIAAYIFFAWPLMYMFTQSTINDLSPEWNHRQFNIFYDRGAHFGHFGRMLKEPEFDTPYLNYMNGQPYIPLDKFIEDNESHISSEIDPNQSTDYNALKSFILKKASAQDFMWNPVANDFSKAKYCKWIRAVESNKNPAYDAEAAFLLKCLYHGRRQIERRR